MNVTATVVVDTRTYSVDAKVTPQWDDFYETEVTDILGPDGEYLDKEGVAFFLERFSGEVDEALIKVAHANLLLGRDPTKAFAVSASQIEKCPIHSLSPNHYIEAGGCRCTPIVTEVAEEASATAALHKGDSPYPPFTEKEVSELEQEALRLEENGASQFPPSPSHRTRVTMLRLIATINAQKVGRA